MYENITFWIQELTRLTPQCQIKIVVSILTVILAWSICRIVKWLVWNNIDEAGKRYRWTKSIDYIYILILVLLFLRIWFRPSWNVMQVLALVAAALTIALQDLVKSFAGWLYLLWRRPFFIGDRIQLDDGVMGDVIDIRVFKLTLNEVGNWVHADQSTGRVIHVPTSNILSQRIVNFTEGFQYIWSELPVTVTFESDWQLAKSLLNEIAQKHSQKISKEAVAKLKEASKKYMLFYHKLTPIVYTSVVDSGVLLTMRFLVEPRCRRGCEEKIWEDILHAFAQSPQIDFAYPTQRLYKYSTPNTQS